MGLIEPKTVIQGVKNLANGKTASKEEKKKIAEYNNALIVMRGPIGFWRRECSECGYSTVNGVPETEFEHVFELESPEIYDKLREFEYEEDQYRCPECKSLLTKQRKNELIVYPSELDQYSNIIPPISVRRKDDSRPKGVVAKLISIFS